MYAVRTAPPPAEAASAAAVAVAPAALPARGVKRSAADDADGEQQRLSKRFGTMTLSEWRRRAAELSRPSAANAATTTTGPVFVDPAAGPAMSYEQQQHPAPSYEHLTSVYEQRPASP